MHMSVQLVVLKFSSLLSFFREKNTENENKYHNSRTHIHTSFSKSKPVSSTEKQQHAQQNQHRIFEETKNKNMLTDDNVIYLRNRTDQHNKKNWLLLSV